MKKAVILLSTLFLALLAGLIVRSQRAGAQLAAAQTAGLSWSNQWSEAQLKVNHQEQMNAALQSRVADRDTHLTASSNALALAQTSLATARADLQTARAALPPALARGDALAAERDSFSNRVQEVEAALRDNEGAFREIRVHAVSLETELAALSHRLVEAQAERARLMHQLGDPQALLAHLAQARHRASTNAAGTNALRTDFRRPLTLQPDGSVVLLPPANPFPN